MAPRAKPDDSDRAAALLVFQLLDGKPAGSYTLRCSGKVLVRMPLAMRYSCANPADENGVLCAGPCLPLWTFSDK